TVRFTRTHEDLLGHPGRLLLLPDAVEEEKKLVPPQARHRILLAHAVLQSCRDLLQDPVPDRVAEGVVDLLETVQVKPQNGEAPTAPTSLGKGQVQAILEEYPVGETGQGIVVGVKLGACLGLLALGDVDESTLNQVLPVLSWDQGFVLEGPCRR